MFARVKNFFYRHRRKFIVTGVIVGGSVLLTRYAQKKFIEWQEKQAKDFFERTRKKHHFESTERTCNQTIISLSLPLKEVILQISNTDECLAKLRSGVDNRIELWEELKLLAFTKHSALLYSGLMFTTVLRVQLNIVGGYICKETVETNFNGNLDGFLQEKYLSLCQQFIIEGAEKLCMLIKRHVKLIVQNIPLSKKLSLKDIEEIFWSIQASITNDPMDPIRNLAQYLLPPNNSSHFSGNDNLSKMISETFEVLESEEAISLSYSCLSRGYSNTLDKIAEYFVPNMKEGSSQGTSSVMVQSSFPDLNKITLPLAKVIPIIHGLMDDGINQDPESWIQQFIVMDKLKMFGANLYEAFSYAG